MVDEEEVDGRYYTTTGRFSGSPGSRAVEEVEEATGRPLGGSSTWVVLYCMQLEVEVEEEEGRLRERYLHTKGGEKANRECVGVEMKQQR